MAETKLSLDTIGDLDGGAARLMIDRAITEAVADLEDRGDEDKAPRTVTIKLAMARKEGNTFLKIAVESKAPARQSRTTVANLCYQAGKPAILFRSDNAENPDQPTFFETEDGEDKA